MNPLRRIEIQYVKGIGPKRAELLTAELGIRTAYDLLRHFPSGYIDRSKTYRIADLTGEMPAVQLRGRFVSMNTIGEGAKMRLSAIFTDGTGSIEVVWFRGIRNIREMYRIGTEYVIFGKPTVYGRTHMWNMAHPEVDAANSSALTEGLRAMYPLTEKLRQRNIGSRQFHQWITALLSTTPPIPETLPASVVDDCRLMSLDRALRAIHNPTDSDTLQHARERLKFEELMYIQADMVRRNLHHRRQSIGHLMPRVGRYFNTFYGSCLPFSLTEAQKRVIREVHADMRTGHQMNRLVQGDVGSGKTLVALMTMLLALDNGYQACLMAPTEILAGQHYETLTELAAQIGVNIKLLTGSTPAAQRRKIHAGLLDGSIHILVGTHAVLEDTVQFHNLGLAVIDEQHRFGVAQRARMWSKNNVPPHILVMTATPIPRTLAMTVYGDLDVSVIDELPPGRKPVTTVLRYDTQRLQVMKALAAQLRQGRQAYIVHPLIHDNPKLELRSVEEGYDIIRETFPQYKVALVHGQLKPDEKDYQMRIFVEGEARIMVATTVIEVGVNVPNASTMIIENAERFGLSQLHQLRGRVGRGADQSYCVLMAPTKLSRDSRQRLELMTQTTDGFVIAEADMRMRGPGDIEGTMQSGIPFDLHIANLATDGQIIQMARNAAEKLLADDPDLSNPANAAFAEELRAVLDRTADWSRIS